MKPGSDSERALAINRAGWDRVAPIFHGGTALPEYGPLAPTEDMLRLLELTPDFRALELGCGSGHSLRYLAERRGRVFTRPALLREVWGYDFYGGTRTVDVHVRRLRAKLGPAHEGLIETVRGAGYSIRQRPE